MDYKLFDTKIILTSSYFFILFLRLKVRVLIRLYIKCTYSYFSG